MYCDDLIFSWRIRLAGYKIIYVPSAIAYHAKKKLAVDGGWKPTEQKSIIQRKQLFYFMRINGHSLIVLNIYEVFSRGGEREKAVKRI